MVETFFRGVGYLLSLLDTQISVLPLGHKVSTFTWVNWSSGLMISSILTVDENFHSCRLLQWVVFD